MQNKNIAIKQLLDLIQQKPYVLEQYLRGRHSLEYKKQQKDQKQDLRERQDLENKKQQAEIDNLTQHIEDLKSATALKKRFTRFVRIYLWFYTLSILIPVWVFLFMKPETLGIHYILVALIGSLTVGLFSCVRATAQDIFGESNNKPKKTN